MQFALPSAGFLARALEPALILALLGSVDSLLASLVADSLTVTQHKSNRELLGQGIGNMVSGLFGGLPGAGSPVLAVTNIRAGGRSRVSGVCYALLMLAMLLGVGRYVERIEWWKRCRKRAKRQKASSTASSAPRADASCCLVPRESLKARTPGAPATRPGPPSARSAPGFPAGDGRDSEARPGACGGTRTTARSRPRPYPNPLH